MLKLYGTKRSSAYRCHWLIAELGLAYETVSVDFAAGENKSEPFLKLNPNGKIPVMMDDDFVLFESFAINAYLAEKHQPALLGSTLQEHGLVAQWNAWALANLADPFMTLILQGYRKTPDNDDTAAARAAIDRFLPILDAALEGKEYLVAGTFTVADINVSSTVAGAETSGVDVSTYANIVRWMQGLNARPAVLKLHAEA
ncbi:MAG: glutathione S-transferase [Patescibacteria group bacterium]|nr:glutathione S-transferase [Patescibacteria group bacterium]